MIINIIIVTITTLAIVIIIFINLIVMLLSYYSFLSFPSLFFLFFLILIYSHFLILIFSTDVSHFCALQLPQEPGSELNFPFGSNIKYLGHCSKRNRETSVEKIRRRK